MNEAMATTELDDFFGDARSGGEFNYKNHKITEEGPNVFRIAPSVKSLKASAQWKIFAALHFGYTMENDATPDKPRHKPFKCIERKNRASGILEQDCPECNLIDAMTQKVEAMKSKYIAVDGMTEEQAEEKVKLSRKNIRDNHSLDKKWYVLAKNLAGEWGVLKVPLKVMRDLVKADEEYKKQNAGASIFHPKTGVWVRFTRTGKGFNTQYGVAIEQETLGGGRFQYKAGELTAVDMKEIQKCPDLANLHDNLTLTYDQISALSKSNNDPETVAKVFGQATKVPAAAATQPAAQQSAPAPRAPAAPAPQAAAPAPAEDDEEAVLMAQLQRARAARAAKAAATAVAAKPATPLVNSNEDFDALLSMSPEAFLERFPDPNTKK